MTLEDLADRILAANIARVHSLPFAYICFWKDGMKPFERAIAADFAEEHADDLLADDRAFLMGDGKACPPGILS